jgi:phosphatidylglycerol:prolipoprotein diacylglycerol transferase
MAQRYSLGKVMVLASLSFPALDPTAIQFGPVHVRWYGLAYLAGFVLAYFVLRSLQRRGALQLTASGLSDLLTYLVIGVLAGGRFGWWIFYHRPGSASEPWYEPLAIWHGGMSFHGGLLGVVVALLIFAWRRSAHFWNIADCVALVAPFGLLFGRIANFVNAELVGRASNLPWAIIFPGDSIPRHPSQLYEALLEGPLLFALLWCIRSRAEKNEGAIAATFLVAYAVLRFVVEFTRQPDEELGFVAFGWMTMGQVLSLAIGVVGVLCLIIRHRRAEDCPAVAPMRQA